MAKTPVIILSYANNADAGHLPFLEEEFDTIKEILSDLNAKEKIKLVTISNATVDKVFNAFDTYGDNIFIFHYIGHAGSAALLFEKEYASASGFATRLSSLKNLKLVFLNGCYTEEHMEFLTEEKVGATLVTRTNVNDSRAKDFSINFYKYLVKCKSIKEAYKAALIRLNVKRDFGKLELKPEVEAETKAIAEAVAKTKERGFVLYKNELVLFPWVLYTVPDKKKHLKWRINNKRNHLVPLGITIFSILLFILSSYFLPKINMPIITDQLDTIKVNPLEEIDSSDISKEPIIIPPKDEIIKNPKDTSIQDNNKGNSSVDLFLSTNSAEIDFQQKSSADTIYYYNRSGVYLYLLSKIPLRTVSIAWNSNGFNHPPLELFSEDEALYIYRYYHSGYRETGKKRITIEYELQNSERGELKNNVFIHSL